MSHQAPGTQPPNTPSFQIPAYVLDDLCSRFVINIPEEERQDLIRIFFQIELAHWFYLDFYCAENPELKTCGIKDFSAQIFHHCPSLNCHAPEVEKILGDWKSYKMSVPTYGAIMLDPERKYCLLVQGFWARASWGFPKGKVNENEQPWECAVREVFEETGFDVGKMMNKDMYLENKMNEQMTRLYIIENVPLDTKFQPKTRKEIKSLQWFPLDSLPSHKRDQISKTQLGLNPNTFFMIIPFVKVLRKWVATKQYQESHPGASGVTGKPPSVRSHSADHNQTNTSKSKDLDNTNRQYRDKQRSRQQLYYNHGNQNEYQEFIQTKDPSKPRSRDARDRKQKTDDKRVQGHGQVSDKRNQGQSQIMEKRSQGHGQMYGSPNYKSDKKQQQYHILNRDGSVGKPRRSLATQFDNQPPGQATPQQSQTKNYTKQDRRQKRGESSGPVAIEQFMPSCWRNFRFNVDAIMSCL